MTLRGWGWSVFPLTSSDIGEKKPRVRWKCYQSRRPTEDELHEKFVLPGVTGIGVVTGRVSGGGLVLAVRDFDIAASYHLWAAAHPDLATRCPTVRTGRGFHAYALFDGPEVFLELPDGELRARHKQIVAAPPSLHPRGGRYEWVGGPPAGLSAFPVLDPARSGLLLSYAPPTPIPEDRKHKMASVPSPGDDEPDIPSIGPHEPPPELTSELREAVLRTQPSGPGMRNDCLLYLARTLRDLCPPGTTADDLWPVVWDWRRQALGVIRTELWADTWRDFRRAWWRAAVPVSESVPLGVMTHAAVRSEAAGGDKRDQLLAACRAMARVSPNGTFHLAVRVAVKAVALPRMTAHRLLSRLVDEGALVVVEPGQPSATVRKATVFRLAG